MSIPEDLWSQVMSLPSEDRLTLGEQLLASVPEVPEDRDPDWEESWAEELNRRIARIESGEANTLSHEEFMKKVQERLARNAE
ncbi:MAG TPA: addiction module protein [Isosphaeraceae bacterium]|nr:addiction module protein [Isosphaeraceae bacterium]